MIPRPLPPRCLGRLEHNPAMDARAPQLGAHALTRATAPDRLNRSMVPFTPRMDRNDQLENCTAVALANAARAAAALRGFGVYIPTDKVVAFYRQSTGYNGTPATDHGGIETAVLNSQARQGFDIGAEAPLVGAWGTFDPTDQNLMRAAISEGGAVCLGVSLSISDKTTLVWDIDSPAAAGDSAPGSWGRHELIGWDYSGTGNMDVVRLGTWGGWQRATWRWLRQRVDEVHLVAWRQLGSTPLSIDYDRLVADTALFAGWANV